MIIVNLNKLMKINSISQYKLVKDTGLDKNTIKRILRAETTAIEFRTIDILCEYFKCDIKDLLTRE